MLCISFSTLAQTPYNVVMNIYGNPTTQMAFNWFTTSNTTGEQVQIAIGTDANPSMFTPFKTVIATSSQNVHKAVVTGLLPETAYSFRVGKSSAWSDIGTFTTAKEPFSFLLTTDSQQDGTNYSEFRIAPEAAFSKYPEGFNFWMHCGDLISTGSKIEQWDGFFSNQQEWFYKTPFVPVQGNHDCSSNQYFKRHFNMEAPTSNFDSHSSTYSFLLYANILQNNLQTLKINV